MTFEELKTRVFNILATSGFTRDDVDEFLEADEVDAWKNVFEKMNLEQSLETLAAFREYLLRTEGK